MKFGVSLKVVDVHCEGEVGRIIVDGADPIPGDTIAARLEYINTVDDSLRRLVTREPRASPAGLFVLLTPSTRRDADIGLIILGPDHAHAMSGSNVMCATTALLETGRVEMTEPETVVTFDTAAGLVKAHAACRNGKCERVAIEMPPAFAVERNAFVESQRFGRVVFDICYGGVFCAVVPVDQLEVSIDRDNARYLAEAGMALRDEISAAYSPRHPDIPEVHGVAYAMFYAEEPGTVVRTCTTLRPGRVDRSPCGTGSNALVALRHEKGLLSPGGTQITRSIIDGVYESTLLSTGKVGPYRSTLSRISGRCWIHAFTELVLDPDDPFPGGFMLTDTWGPDVKNLED